MPIVIWKKVLWILPWNNYIFRARFLLSYSWFDAWCQQPSPYRNLNAWLIIWQNSTSVADEIARCQSIPFTTNIQLILKKPWPFIKTSILIPFTYLHIIQTLKFRRECQPEKYNQAGTLKYFFFAVFPLFILKTKEKKPFCS